MKKIMLILIIVLFVLFNALCLLYNSFTTLMTNSQIERVDIIIYQNNSVAKVFEITDEGEIAQIQALLKNIKTEAVLFPEGDGQVSDSTSEIILCYQNKEKDTIYSTETGKGFYRLSSTKGVNRANGYVLGMSEILKKYIDNISLSQ